MTITPFKDKFDYYTDAHSSISAAVQSLAEAGHLSKVSEEWDEYHRLYNQLLDIQTALAKLMAGKSAFKK